MTSAIVSSTINENFPVAGQDNNSVGFRNNFTYIKTGLATAAGEITTLQADTAKTNADNDFNGVKIENAETNLLYGTIETNANWTADLASGGNSIIVPNAEYFYYKFTGSDPVNRAIQFSNWPAGGFSKIRIDLQDSGTVRTITFSEAGLSGVFVDNGLTYPFVTDGNANAHYIFEVWTIDGGDNIFIKYLGTFEAI